MKPRLPRLTRALAAAALCLAVAPAALAQTAWPAKPVRIMVPFGPGALTDVAARAIAQELSQQLGQQFVVENRGGGGGTLGTAEVAKSAPDGHTLVFTDSSYMISAALYAKLPYDPLKDLVPVVLAVEAPAIMVARPGLPVQSLRDMVTLAKAKPRTLTYGSGGQGASAHLATELFTIQAGIELVHVPFKGVAAALTEVVGDRIDVTVSSVGAAAGHVRSGKVRPLAISGAQRIPLLPDVPTFAESGFPGYAFNNWYALMAPVKTPKDKIATIRAAVQ